MKVMKYWNQQFSGNHKVYIKLVQFFLKRESFQKIKSKGNKKNKKKSQKIFNKK